MSNRTYEGQSRDNRLSVLGGTFVFGAYILLLVMAIIDPIATFFGLLLGVSVNAWEAFGLLFVATAVGGVVLIFLMGGGGEDNFRLFLLLWAFLFFVVCTISGWVAQNQFAAIVSGILAIGSLISSISVIYNR